MDGQIVLATGATSPSLRVLRPAFPGSGEALAGGKRCTQLPKPRTNFRTGPGVNEISLLCFFTFRAVASSEILSSRWWDNPLSFSLVYRFSKGVVPSALTDSWR